MRWAWAILVVSTLLSLAAGHELDAAVTECLVSYYPPRELLVSSCGPLALVFLLSLVLMTAATTYILFKWFQHFRRSRTGRIR